MLYKGVSKVNGESYIGNLVVMGHNFFIRNQNSTSYDDKYIEVFEDSLSKELMKGIFENDIIICDGVKSVACLIDGVPSTLTKIPLCQFKEVKLCEKNNL